MATIIIIHIFRKNERMNERNENGMKITNEKKTAAADEIPQNKSLLILFFLCLIPEFMDSEKNWGRWYVAINV